MRTLREIVAALLVSGGLVACAAGLEWLLLRAGAPTFWLPFLAAVVASAFLRGPKGGALAAILSAAVSWLAFRAAHVSLAGGVIATVVFFLLAFFLTLIVEHLNVRTREAARAAQQAESDMRTAILDSSGAGIALLKGRVVEWTNRRMTEIFGRPDSELIGRTTEHLFVNSEDFARLGENAYPLINSGAMYSVETQLQRKDGTAFWCSLTGRLVDASRPERGSIWVVQDVHARRLQETKLRESEAKYRQAFDINSAVKLIIDPESGQIIDANSAACLFYGWSREALLAKHITDINILSPEEVRTEMAEAAEQKRLHFEFRHRLASGEIRDVEVYSGPIVIDGRKCLHSIIHDVTARKKAEADLRESEARFRNLIESVDAIVFTLDLEGRHTGVYGHWLSRFGLTAEDFLGRTADEIMGPENGRVHMEANARAAAGETVSYEWTLPNPSGESTYQTTLSPIRTANRVTGIVGVGQEVTERKRLQETLERNMRLESVGVLAGGIAHDFNNLLTGIYGHIEMARLSTDPAETAELLGRAGATIGRARKLTGQLITFARGGSPEPRAERLFPFAQDAVSFALAGSSRKLSVNVPPDLWRVRYDAAQISQVLENLTLNARQASQEGSRIEVTAENLTIAEPQADLEPGLYVQLSIRDHGTGMPPDVAARAFDPFFTTRPGGTGLGLPTAYSIVKRHKGALRLETLPGVGTVFHVILPAAPEEEAAPASIQMPAQNEMHGPVLLMDDQEDVRDVLSTQLKALGYSPYCTCEGSEAVALFEKRHREFPFAAVLLDLTIPGGMGGLETARAIRAMDSSVPIYIVSGYAREALPADLAKAGITNLLQKPFKLEELQRLLSSGP